ncbi:FAD-binding oxidoreductase [Aliiroseovarius sp.]|uniref:NAD(P)/FAD-dependent oxidoreductase n=1 Tax=Aliiroseovarius sp. TaxID=1872442 RepID=UPI00262CA352|nr:FAD-binding oxidoreductase [Aliiroseovarius sp.]
MQDSYDVVIVGGAMIGSSVAWHLISDPGFDGRVLVIERDPSYLTCSTAHTNSCIRMQFSTPLNVRVSQYGVDYVKNFRARMGDERVPEIHMHAFGYMYLAGDEAAAETLRVNQHMQAGLGAATRLLTPDELAAQYPFYDLDGIVLGSHNPVNEGYFDGTTMFDWWRRLARERGVEFLHDEVVGMRCEAGRVVAVDLASGGEVACGMVVNAAGPRAGRVAAMAGLELPVEPRKRYTWVVEAASPLGQDLPLTIDPSGVHVRTDGRYYMIGATPDEDPAVEPDDFVEDFSLWEQKAWPAVATRIPQFEALRVVNSWVGHYAFNTVDQNAVLGPHPELENFLFVNGFSGHGFQQAPAMGRGVAEWILHGEYRTLDLSDFGFARLARGGMDSELRVI